MSPNIKNEKENGWQQRCEVRGWSASPKKPAASGLLSAKEVEEGVVARVQSGTRWGQRRATILVKWVEFIIYQERQILNTKDLNLQLVYCVECGQTILTILICHFCLYLVFYIRRLCFFASGTYIVALKRKKKKKPVPRRLSFINT